MPSRRAAFLALVVVSGCVASDCAADAEPPGWFRAEVIRVIDGDTVDVKFDGGVIRVRLRAIDAPEMDQPGGVAARDALRALSEGESVRVIGAANDYWERRLAEILLPDGRSLNRLQVEAGHAWLYRKYSDDVTLRALEAWAREQRRGLWQEANPTPPWEFRHPARADARSPVAGTPPADGAVIGNRSSGVYHAPGCPSRDEVSPRNRVPFDSVSAAEQAGYRRAGNCPR
jgi:endonuclease YncB( thermonuclease family)